MGLNYGKKVLKIRVSRYVNRLRVVELGVIAIVGLAPLAKGFVRYFQIHLAVCVGFYFVWQLIMNDM